MMLPYSQKAETRMYSFWKKWGNGIQVTGFSFPGYSDALNFYQLRHCCTENHCHHFNSEHTIVDMLPVWLSSLWVEIVTAAIYHTIFLHPKPIFLLTLVKPLFNFSTVAVWWISRFSWMTSSTFCCSVFELQWQASQILTCHSGPLSLDFLSQGCTVPNSTVSLP